MNEEEFDQLSLPKDSANENLETLSRQKLAALFSIELFELRDELQHDKGVDLFVELKRCGSFTNFRFAVQLKATRAVSYNSDGSLSSALDVSNINYLMNHNMPAYYILYEARRNAFFYVEAFRVYEKLTTKYADKNNPKTYSCRFNQLLDEMAVAKLYNDTFERGRLLREVNPLLQMNLQQNQAGSNVVINQQQEAYTTAQKVSYLEKYGFQLLNAAQFKKVIELEQQCYPLPTATGEFHYVAGMAYYHQANMYQAIDHLKKAAKMAGDLHPEMVVMVGYYTAMARFALGILSKDEIKKVIDKFKHSTYVGLYLRVTEAYNQYIMGEEDESVKYKQFYRELELIKSAPASDANIRLLADTQAVQVEGQRLNNELMEELMLERAKPFNAPGQGSGAFDDAVASYNSKINILQNRAKLENNYLTYLIICLNSLKINYTSVAMAYCIRNFDEATLTSNYKLDPIALSWLEERLDFLEETAEFYLELGYLENMVVALSLKYEILHFIGDTTAAQAVKEYLAGILDANDLVEYQRKFDHLINGETFHEVTLKMLVANFEKVAAAKPEADKLQQEIDVFDAKDVNRSKTVFADQMNIDIFPLGWFAFPGDSFETVMDALHVEGPVREQFEWMLKDGVIAQLNAFNDPVTSEGHGEGIRAHKGILSLRNLYRIRKWLFDQGYCRVR